MAMAEPRTQARPQEARLPRPDARLGTEGFCVGIDLFITHKRMTSSWVSDIVEGWASYFVSEWPGFRLEAVEYSALQGARAVVLADFAATEISPMQRRRAEMWWKGIPVFGTRGDTMIIERECYDSRAVARAALVPGTDDGERRVA